MIGKTEEQDRTARGKHSICKHMISVNLGVWFQELEEHGNAKKDGQIKDDPHENVKLESYYTTNVLSLVLHAQEFEKEVQVHTKSPTIFH